MKSFKEYCFEKLIDIFEAKLQRSDFDKHDYKYTKNLINMLIDGKDIKLIGKDGKKPSGVYSAKYLGDDTIKELEDLLDKINNEENVSMDDFNKILIDGETGLKYSSFFKGQFSGFDGKTMGQMFESCVCYMFNNEKYDIDEWAEFMQISNTQSKEFESWVESSEKSVELIKNLISNHLKENPKDYIAYHVDGDDYKLPQNHDKYSILAKIFRGKPAIKEINKSASNIYSGGGKSKDKWNPADIVLVKKIKDDDLEMILSTLKTKGLDGKQFNAKLVELLGSNILLPISLKKVTKNSGKVYGHNIDNGIELDKHKIDLSYIQLGGSKNKTNDDRGIMVIFGVNTDLDEKTEIQFRRSTNNNPSLVIELRLESKMARGGKGLERCKDVLGIKDNSYLNKVNLSSNDDLISFFEKHGFKDNSKTIINSVPDKLKEFDLYKRICYKGFCGIFELYLEKNSEQLKGKSNDEIIQLFTEFIYLCCVDCPGSYYIIK